MICSACRLARQQLANSTRRAATTSSATSSSIARRSIATAVRSSSSSSSTRPSLSQTVHPTQSTILSTTSYARNYSAAAAAPSEPVSSNSSAPSPIPKPDFLDEAESHIWDLLVAAFAPHELSVRDISGGCGSMYGIEISSEKFKGANMLKQQRMVNAALGDLIKGWHGVQLKTRVPE